jgi:hypothetical protein
LVDHHTSGLAAGWSVGDLYVGLAGEIMGSPEYTVSVAEGRPRLTEPWFC